jgi:hypothetical protein
LMHMSFPSSYTDKYSKLQLTYLANMYCKKDGHMQLHSSTHGGNFQNIFHTSPVMR